MLKPWVLVVLALIFLSLFVLSLFPFFVNAESFRPAIESQLSGAFGREVTMGHITFAIIAGSLDADDFSIADDPQFSNVPFIQARKLNIGVELLPIVFHHQVHITTLKIDTPSIQLIQNANGTWNFSSFARIRPGETQQPDSGSNLIIEELKISDGNATISSIPITKKPFQYTEVNVTLRNFSFLKSFPFEVSAKLPGEGSLKLNGDAGPISRLGATQTPFQATLQLSNFDPVASGLIDKSKGIGMQSEVDAQLKSDGTEVSSTGKIKASQLQLVPRGSPAREPVDIDFTVSHNIDTRKGTVSDIAVHSGAAAVHANGTFELTPQAVMLDLRVSAPGLPIDQLERLMPMVGIHLPSGSSLQGGTVTANITIAGPATTATLAGPVEIDNTKLAGYDLGSKIEGLSPLSGTSGGTEIQVLKATVNSSPQDSKITDIYGNLPQLGTATGNGTIAESGAINFNLDAKLNSQAPVSSAKPAPSSNRAIPLTITGTAVSPTIKANTGATPR